MNKSKLYKLFGKFTEFILGTSSIITSITVLLIIGFLFKEGSNVFDKKPIEEGYVLAVNPNNPINQIKPSIVKDIFDQKITNWNQIKGGKNEAIKLLRIDDITKYYDEDELGANFEHLPAKIDEFTKKNPGVIIFISETYLSKQFPGKQINVDQIKLKSFLQGEEWFPTAQPIAQMGVKPLILGTLWVSIGAILIALPIGLGVSIYLSEIATKKVRNILKPIIELLAAIPSVVYGFFGLVVLVPLVQQIFNLPVGETGLSGSIILAIMALPTIITVSEDAMRNTPRSMKEASLALGATHWQTIYKVIIPYASSGITTAAILGIGRAIGETMAVLMVTGNAAVIPHSLLTPLRTIPATIAAELGEAPSGGIHYQALFALGCILFIMTFIINIGVELISGKKQKQQH